MIEWSKLDANIRNSLLNPTFKKQILEFASLSPNSIFQILQLHLRFHGLNYLTGLQAGLSHLLE